MLLFIALVLMVICSRCNMRYKDTLYKAIGTDAVVQYEEERMINRLQSSKSPCLGQTDLSLWFIGHSSTLN
ncbi:hypothetical protein CLU79DRAFT_776960 [Phycomyces nitens]|nr:hypothetical protein CLU79DRAFT_776960 [Phycomyces nitens]